MTWQLDATALSTLLDARDITPLQLLKQSLARLDATEPVLNAFTHVDRGGALAAAEAAAARGRQPAPAAARSMGFPCR